MRKIHWPKWEYVQHWLAVVQTVVVVLGVGFSVYQVNEIANNQLSRDNQLSIQYYDRINTGKNKEIYLATAHKTPILRRFTNDQLDDFLGELHAIGIANGKGLLDPELVCSDFAEIVEQVWKDNEIQQYITESRKENALYFDGFDKLYESIQSCK